MSIAARLAGGISSHSLLVVAVLLVVFAAIGAGAPAVDDDSSLEQFEGEYPEVEASEYIQDHLTPPGAENQTTLQLITRGENVLTKNSLLASLEFQVLLRSNERINATLAQDDPISGVENVVAITAIVDEQVEELEAEADELEAEGERLEARGDRLEERVATLEAESRQLEQDHAELTARTATLEEALVTVGPLLLDAEMAGNDSAREEANQTLDAAAAEANLDGGQTETLYEAAELTIVHALIDELAENETSEQILYDGLEDVLALQVELEAAETSGEEAAIEDEINQTINQTIDDAGLEGLNATIWEQFVHEFRTEADGLTEIPSHEELAMGVLEDEFRALEERGDTLEREATMIEREADRLEQWAEDLEAWGDELEARGEALEDIDPTLAEQIEHLEGMDEDEVRAVVADALSDGDGPNQALGLMPRTYQPGETTANSRMTVITQTGAAGGAGGMGPLDDELVETQLEIRSLATAHGGEDEYIVFGAGIMFEEIDQSMGDSLAIVGPLALLLVVAALLVAYRDILDIVLGVTGILLVLLLTFGFMGWAGITFNQLFVAVPVLLIGLSIDYAIHVFMRHREQRLNGAVSDTVGGSMSVALAGVGVALVWVTATTAIGFLANTVSPIQPIREFGIVSAFGIVAALVVFGLFVPAAKVELDELLEGFGMNRKKRAFGTGGGRLGRVLSGGAIAARRAPVAVLLVVLLITGAGIYGASQVDTSFEQEDFLADSPPAWTQYLPGPLAPGEYQAKEDLAFVSEHFQRADAQVNILIRGDVADAELLRAIDRTESDLAEAETVFIGADGEPTIQSPLSAMEFAAAQNESFNESFHDADTTGDGIPDEDLESLYDELLAADEGAGEVLYRTEDGSYEAAQLVIAIDGDADFGAVTTEMRGHAAALEAEGPWTAIATGDPIVNYLVEQDLFETVLESLAITLVAVFLFLTLAYWLTGKGAVLGAVTLIPVALTVSWILGTMYLLGMPFNVMTGMITSLTIGLGVAYSIHISSRYTLELDRTGNVWEAMDRTVTGTGGALLGSAATTVGGFGTLALAILPALQQFGIITGLTIIYAFLASVIVLPTLLVLWTRWFGPGGVTFEVPTRGPSQVAADGGGEDE